MKKLAFPTEDGQTISAHFGRAPYYVVVSLNDDAAPQMEQREKQYHGAEHERDHHGHDHGHGSMFAPISDCQVLIAGGMGQPAFEHAKNAGLEVVMTGTKNIQEAVRQYQEGTLLNDVRRIHQH